MDNKNMKKLKDVTILDFKALVNLFGINPTEESKLSVLEQYLPAGTFATVVGVSLAAAENRLRCKRLTVPGVLKIDID